MQAVQEFAHGAPQEDDMTVVLVKREPSPAAEHRLFPRTFESLQEIFAFTAQAFARLGVNSGLLQAVDFTVEELFTNMVKYSTTSRSAVRLELRPIADGVEAVLTDYDVDAFDVTQAPDANVHLSIEQRRPGGLGLHLIRRLVDSIEYHYFQDTRQSRITFRKTVEGASASERSAGSDNDAAN
jgi:anti-sigma regulatory factor (Ser/Thr protein kinase)